MTLHGYADWERVEQHASAEIVNIATTTGAVTTLDLGTLFVGDCTHLAVMALSGNGPVTLTITYLPTSTSVNASGIDGWVSDGANHTIQDVSPIKGAWAHCVLTFPAPAAVRTPTVVISKLVMAAQRSDFSGGGLIVSQFDPAMPVGTVTNRIPAIREFRGKVYFDIQAAAWAMVLRTVDMFGVANDLLVLDNASGYGQRNEVPFLIPRIQCYLVVINAAGAPAYFNVRVVAESTG